MEPKSIGDSDEMQIQIWMQMGYRCEVGQRCDAGCGYRWGTGSVRRQIVLLLAMIDDMSGGGGRASRRGPGCKLGVGVWVYA